MKKPLMMLICAGIVILAMFISIIVAHGKISSTERKLSLCNDELNKVSQQLKELKEYTANLTYSNPNESETTTTSSTRYYYYDDDDDDDDDDVVIDVNSNPVHSTVKNLTQPESDNSNDDNNNDDNNDDSNYEEENEE